VARNWIIAALSQKPFVERTPRVKEGDIEMAPGGPGNWVIDTLQGTNPYPTLGKGKSSTQKCRLVGDMFILGRVNPLPTNISHTWWGTVQSTYMDTTFPCFSYPQCRFVTTSDKWKVYVIMRLLPALPTGYTSSGRKFD